MFTGIVQTIGTIQVLQHVVSGDLRVSVAASGIDLGVARVGDSIAVAGICLTVIALRAETFDAEVSPETLAVTTARQWCDGSQVNIEAALRVGDALGGHWVSGHVDGLAQLLQIVPDAGSVRMRWRVPATLARYIARKGSVTLDGVSLTVNTVEGTDFEVNLIPHTQQATTLGALRVGDRANLEVDLMARYAERLLPAP
jgi:riboflavin synthase